MKRLKELISATMIFSLIFSMGCSVPAGANANKKSAYYITENEVFYTKCDSLVVDLSGAMWIDSNGIVSNEPPKEDNYLQIGRNNVGHFYVMLYGDYQWEPRSVHWDGRWRVKAFRNASEAYQE
jgi:hypothetical protein